MTLGLPSYYGVKTSASSRCMRAGPTSNSPRPPGCLTGVRRWPGEDHAGCTVAVLTAAPAKAVRPRGRTGLPRAICFQQKAHACS